MRALTRVNNARLFGPGFSSFGRFCRQSQKRKSIASLVWEEGPWFALFAENFMHEISGIFGAELLQQIGSVEINSTRADAECPSGLLAGGAPTDLSRRNWYPAAPAPSVVDGGQGLHLDFPFKRFGRVRPARPLAARKPFGS
jgi:hypothetical protein